jgi:hypothetical protein
MFKSTMPVGRSRPSLPDLDLIANKTRLVMRKSRKFDPAAFLQTLLSSVVTGHASFSQLAGDLKDRVAAPMARQSLHERFGEPSTAFLLTVLCDLMEQRYQPAAEVLRGGPILRVIIEDSSSQVMPKSNAAAFPAHGNHHGPTAGVKIDFAFDLLSGAIVSHTLQQATGQDKTIGRELICGVLRGDLVVRDMGYFSLGEFSAIEERAAWWLTRLPLTTSVLLGSGGTLEKYPKTCRKALNRKSNAHHMQALALAAMIAHQLGMRIARGMVNRFGRAGLSYEKLYDLLAVCLVKARHPGEVIAFDPDPRHIQRDQRSRKSPVESGILALT